MKTKRITYAAVCTALGALAVIIGAYTTANIVPLVFYSAALYLSLRLVGAWGVLSAAASLALAFFTAGGFCDVFVLTLVMFTPYAFLAFFMRKISYRGVRNSIIRGAVVVAFFIAEAFVTVLLAGALTGVDFTIITDKVGSWALFVMFALLGVPTDFFFVFATDKLLGILKADSDGEKE